MIVHGVWRVSLTKSDVNFKFFNEIVLSTIWLENTKIYNFAQCSGCYVRMPSLEAVKMAWLRLKFQGSHLFHNLKE